MQFTGQRACLLSFAPIHSLRNSRGTLSGQSASWLNDSHVGGGADEAFLRQTERRHLALQCVSPFLNAADAANPAVDDRSPGEGPLSVRSLLNQAETVLSTGQQGVAQAVPATCFRREPNDRQSGEQMNHVKKTLARTELVLGLAMVLVAMLAVPASAAGAEIVRGDLAAFADGPGLGFGDLTGRVQMVRTGDSKTIVNVQVWGLEPGATFGSHVHNQACADTTAGGHYSFGHPVAGGAGPGDSEIWPGPFTANQSGHANGQVSVGETAGISAISVVIHGPGGQKIGCADLS